MTNKGRPPALEVLLNALFYQKDFIGSCVGFASLCCEVTVSKNDIVCFLSTYSRNPKRKKEKHMSSWSSLLQLLSNTNTLQTDNDPQLHIRKQTSMLDRISRVIGSAGRWGSLMKTAEWAFQVARFIDVHQLWKETLK